MMISTLLLRSSLRHFETSIISTMGYFSNDNSDSESYERFYFNLARKNVDVIELCSGHYECAKLLVHFGIDLDSWTETEDGEQTQTLLHLMMDLGNQQAAIFLIEK